MASDRPTLTAEKRTETGSRSNRRLRNSGRVPGVVYGSGRDPVVLQVDEREFRHLVASGQALFDLVIDGGETVPVVVKERQHHPVRDQFLHIDFQQVRLDVEIESTVPLHLEGEEEAPGVQEGGVLEHVTAEVTVSSLPANIPEFLTLDVSHMVINDTVTLEAVRAPEGVTITTDPETTVATLNPPRIVEEEEPEVEEEAELVGEGEEAPAEGEEAPAEGEEPAAEQDEGTDAPE